MEGKLIEEVIEFFSENPILKTEKVMDFCNKVGIHPNYFSAVMYHLLGSFLGRGLSVKKKNMLYNATQLGMGQTVEMEHTSCPYLAFRIAKDHLAEIPDYYTRLAKMEKEAGI